MDLKTRKEDVQLDRGGEQRKDLNCQHGRKWKNYVIVLFVFCLFFFKLFSFKTIIRLYYFIFVWYNCCYLSHQIFE